MGVFGAGIFADDDALDVRSDYKVFVGDAQSDTLATDAIAHQYGASFADPAATTSFWLALAWTQWTIGRLDAGVKSCALRVIDENLDLENWHGSPLYRKREQALQQARRKIDSPQPLAKPIPKPLPVQLPGWEFSEIVGVRMPNGRLALLHMMTYRTTSRYAAKAPAVSILNCSGTIFLQPKNWRLSPLSTGAGSNAEIISIAWLQRKSHPCRHRSLSTQVSKSPHARRGQCRLWRFNQRPKPL